MSNAASTPEFKAILKAVYDSGQAKTSGEALSMAWAEYRRKHHGGVVSVQQRRYAYRKSFENPRHYDRPHPGYKGKRDRSRDLLPCECSDPGCPVHKGSEQCSKRGKVTVYRSDMEDRTGTLMCEGCAADAMDSGVFYTKNPRRKRSRKVCRHCGAQMSGDVCLACLKKNPQTRKTRFKDIATGTKFEFSSIREFPHSGMQTGPWIKITKRQYTAADANHRLYRHKITIGTVNATVDVLNPREMRPRIQVSKRKRRGKLGARSPLKGFRINKNPIAVYNPRGGVKLPARNIEIRYQRSGGEYNGEWFKHPFKSSVSLIGLADGSVLIKSNSGRKLWGKV